MGFNMKKLRIIELKKLIGGKKIQGGNLFIYLLDCLEEEELDLFCRVLQV